MPGGTGRRTVYTHFMTERPTVFAVSHASGGERGTKALTRLPPGDTNVDARDPKALTHPHAYDKLVLILIFFPTHNVRPCHHFRLARPLVFRQSYSLGRPYYHSNTNTPLTRLRCTVFSTTVTPRNLPTSILIFGSFPTCGHFGKRRRQSHHLHHRRCVPRSPLHFESQGLTPH